MGKTIRLNKEQSTNSKFRILEKPVRPKKQALLDPSLSSRKARSRIKQRSWPLGSEKKKGHVI